MPRLRRARRPLALAFVTTLATAAGAGPADAARWTAPAGIPGAERATLPYDVAVGSDGTVAVAFRSTGGVRVVVRRHGRWLRPHTVSRAGGYGESTPRVAVDGAGEVLAVWVRTTSRGSGPTRGPYLIEARSRDRRGRWGAERTLGRSGHFAEPGLDVAVDARGDAIVAWRGVRRVGRRNRDAPAAAYRRAGRVFGAPHVMTEAEPAAEQRVAIDRQGAAHVVWTALRSQTAAGGPVVRHARRSGTAGWSAPRTVAAAPASRPTVAVTDGRAAVVAWRAAETDSEGDGVQSGALMARVRSPSGRWASPQTLSPTAVHEGVLATTPGIGQTVALWRRTGDADGLGWAVRPPAAVFGAAGVLAAGAATAPWPPALATVGDGSTVAAWSEPYGAAGEGGVHASVRPARGTFGPVEEVSPDGLYPDMAGAGGRAVAVWLAPEPEELPGRGPGLRWAQWLP